MKKLIEERPDLVSMKDAKSAPLFYAASYSDEKTVVQLLLSNADPNIKDQGGLTPLHVSLMARDHSHGDGSTHGHQEEIAAILLKHGADFRATGQKGENILILSILGGYHGLVKELIGKGANVTVNAAGITPVIAALIKAARAEDEHHRYVDIAILLIESGADLNVTGPDGESPIDLAGMVGSLELIKAIIMADEELMGGRSIELLTSLASTANVDLAEMLIENGAEINGINKEGKTALHVAARAGQAEFCKYLINKGADINMRIISGPYAGDSPLDEAYSGLSPGKQSTIKVLKDVGAQSGRIGNANK